MSLTKAQTTEILDVVKTGLHQFKQIEILERKLISDQLDRIEEQVKKTNGTVLKHTEQLVKLEMPHSKDNCIQTADIQTLHDTVLKQAENMITRKDLVKLLTISVAVIGVVVTIINVVIGVYEKSH